MLPQVPAKQDRIFFFDLADPEKLLARRSRLRAGYDRPIRKIRPRHARGLNLKEAQQVFTTLGFGSETETENGLRTMARKIRAHLNLTTVVVHPKESAACATRENTFWGAGASTPPSRSSPRARATISTPASSRRN